MANNQQSSVDSGNEASIGIEPPDYVCRSTGFVPQNGRIAQKPVTKLSVFGPGTLT